MPRHGRPHRIGQQVPHVASLLAARRHDGENPLHEATAVRTLSAEPLFAPDHGRTEHAFGGVVGRRNPRMGHNRPERIPPGQHLLAEGRDVVPRSGASVFQGCGMVDWIGCIAVCTPARVVAPSRKVCQAMNMDSTGGSRSRAHGLSRMPPSASARRLRVRCAQQSWRCTAG